MIKSVLSIVLIYLITISSVFGATAQVNNVVNPGGGINSQIPAFTLPADSVNSAKLITLSGGVGSTATNAWYSLSKLNSGNAQYQVPVGKTLYIIGFYCGTASVNNIMFGYATASFSFATTSTPTGATNYSPNNDAASSGLYCSGSHASPVYMAISMSFPASSYPFFRYQSGATTLAVNLIGYEL